MLDFHIAGIPCLIEVTEHIVVPPWKGNIQSCPSEADYYGYEEIEFNVLDRGGRLAPWLERKMTDEEYDSILALVREA